MKAENAAVREHLRKMEEQQKALLELVERLQRRLDGVTTADVAHTDQPTGPAQIVEASASSTAAGEVRGVFASPSPRLKRIQRTTIITRMELLSGKIPTTPRCLSC